MENADAPILVTIDVSNIRHDLASMVREQVGEAIDAHLKKAVLAEVHAIAVDVVRDKIKAAAEEAFATGWTKTDEYGRPDGKVKTVRDMILEHLTTKDRYSNDASWMQRMLNEQLAATIKAVVQPEIDAARKAFKEMLDGTIREKLAGALREAMGLK